MRVSLPSHPRRWKNSSATTVLTSRSGNGISIWLGVWPREVDQYTVEVDATASQYPVDEHVIVERNAEGGVRSRLQSRRPVSSESGDWLRCRKGARRRYSPNIYVYKTTFSGILTGDFGKSYQYREPVINLIQESPSGVDPVWRDRIHHRVRGCSLYGYPESTGASVKVRHRVVRWSLCAELHAWLGDSGPCLLMLLATDTFLDATATGWHAGTGL